MIIGAGEALMDLVPTPVPGGAPLNVAIAAQRLGARSAFLGRISTDAEGEALMAYLAENGISTGLVQRGPEPTPLVNVETSPRVRYWIDEENTAESLLEVPSDGNLPESAILHSGALAMFRGKTAETMLEVVKAHSGIVSLDPNIRPQLIPDRESWIEIHEQWLPNVDIYKVSDEDFEWIWPSRTVDSVVGELLAVGLSVVVLTTGSEGGTLYSERGPVGSDGVAVNVVDTVGAGDTFIGSFLASVKGLGIESSDDFGKVSDSEWGQILQRANAAAALCCSRKGANPPTLDELAVFQATL